MKTIYEVWSRQNNKVMLTYQCESLRDAGFKLGKLINIGVNCWLQIREN